MQTSTDLVTLDQHLDQRPPVILHQCHQPANPLRNPPILANPLALINSEPSKRGRAKFFDIRCGIIDMEDFKKKCGPRWCYIFQDAILNTALPTGTIYPSLALAVEDTAHQFARACLLEACTR